MFKAYNTNRVADKVSIYEQTLIDNFVFNHRQVIKEKILLTDNLNAPSFESIKDMPYVKLLMRYNFQKRDIPRLTSNHVRYLLQSIKLHCL